MSLIRTSVITTVDLLFSVAHSRATPNHIDPQSPTRTVAGGSTRSRGVLHPPGEGTRLPRIPAEGKQAGSTAAHHLPRGAKSLQPLQDRPDFRTQPFGHFLQPVVHPPTDLIDVPIRDRLPQQFPRLGV